MQPTETPEVPTLSTNPTQSAPATPQPVTTTPMQPPTLRQKPKRRVSIFLTLVIAVVGAVIVFRSFAATATEPTIGVMIQVSSLSPTVTPAKLKTYLDDIRRDHRKQTPVGYVQNVVLQDIADKNGNLYTEYLDVIAPYLPGGATPTFTNAYIGGVDLAWTGSGSKYIEGIANPTFRNTNVTLSTNAAKAFKARYPKAVTNWYITYEANLSGFWDQNIETNYATYINQIVTSLNGVTAGRTFMWSPAFWTPYRNQPSWALPGLQANFTHFFNTVKTPPIVNFQDFVGQSKGASTKEDALAWAVYLKNNWSAKVNSIQINAEQFRIDTTGALVPADNAEIAARETFYAFQGVKVGPSWEIRYWHKRLYGI